VYEGVQITVEVPLGYDQRDQLLSFMEKTFPGADVSIVHGEVGKPTVAEAFIRHDSSKPAAETAEAPEGLDSEAVLIKASDALSGFTKAGA
jgi:hypothetical protein